MRGDFPGGLSKIKLAKSWGARGRAPSGFVEGQGRECRRALWYGQSLIAREARLRRRGSFPLGPALPVEANGVIADLFSISLTIETPRLLLAALDLFGLASPGRLDQEPVMKSNAGGQTYQQPVRLRRFGSGAPGNFGRGIERRFCWSKWLIRKYIALPLLKAPQTSSLID